MNATTDRILTAIFCDDIRQEVGDKMSFMGCYQSELFVQGVPMVLPKLCVFITILTPKARPFKSLVLRVVLDETTELARVEIPPEGFANLPDVQDDTATRSSISTAVMFSPFVIEKPAVLRVLADTEEGELIGPRLLMKVAPAPASLVVAPSSGSETTATEKKTRKKRVRSAK